MKIITTLLLFIATINLNSQIPENFELLDHNQRWSNLGANLMIGDSLIYVSHNGQWPMTTVKIAYINNEIKTIFESPFSGESKVVLNQDGTTDIFIYNLIDYDVELPGFYIIHIENGRYNIEKYVDETYDNIDYDFFAYDVIRDTDSTYWLIRENDLAKLSNGVVEPYLDLGQSYNQKFHKNTEGDIFIYKNENLFLASQDSLIELIEFATKINDIATYQDNNVVLIENSLLVYNSDFTNLIRTWDLPSPVPSLQYLQLIEDNLYVLSTEDEAFDLHIINSQGNDSLILSGFNEYEFIKGFHMHNDSSFLLKAALHESNIYKNIFLRNVSAGSSKDYTRLDFEINEFKLHNTGKDSAFNHVIVDGDSIFTYSFFYDFDVSFRNNSDSVISSTNVFSRSYYNFIGPFSAYFQLDFLEDIVPGERINKTGSFSVPFTYNNSLDDLKVIAPGANNRFNASSFSSIIADYTSSIYDPNIRDYTITIYPNPTSDFLNIKSDLPLRKYLIYDSAGFMIQAGSSSASLINVSSLVPGLYYLKVLSDNNKNSSISRFIKQ